MKLNKTIIISDIISILLAFTLFIWIFIEMKCVAIVYDRILNNLFIKDFNPVQKINLGRNLCQEKDMYSLVNYTFPGIPESCYNNETKKIEKNCKDPNFIKIEKIDKKNFTIWRNKVLCVKYFEYDNSHYKFINKTNSCETGYKQCGTLNNGTNKTELLKKLCVKDNIECPLNFITITNDTKIDYDPSIYDIIPFENGYYLITSNKITDGGVITKIRIAEGDLPCYEKDRYSNTTNQFPSMNNIGNFNCSNQNIDEKSDEKVERLRALLDDKNDKTKELIDEGYDVRFQKFDNQIKSNVLIENDLDYAYSHLPNLSDWNQDMYTGHFNLFYLNAFIIKEDCHDFENLETTITKLKNVQGARVVFALFHILIYVLLFSILGLIKVILAWRHSMLFGIKVGLSFIISGFNYLLIIYSEEYISILGIFTNLEECLDEVSVALLNNHNIQLILKELNTFYSREKIVWYFYIFFNFIEACRLIHKVYLRCKNTYRRNIANKEIGAENLKKIFEKVRNELEKKKEIK